MSAPVQAAVTAPRGFLSDPMALVGATVLVVLGLAAIFAPVIARVLEIDPEAQDLLNRFAPSSPEHLLGTDALGRDLFMRLLEGARVSLAVGLAAAMLAAVIGTAIGLAAGYLGGWVDAALMRVTDGLIALPILPLLILLAALDPTKLGLGGLPEGLVSVVKLIVLIALLGWTTVARLVRGATVALGRATFVTAARAAGASPARIMRRHILPNVLTPVIVATVLTAGNVILIESALSFLGLGVQPPTPSWGNMLTGAQETLFQAPAAAIWPGVFIPVTVASLHLVGDGLQRRGGRSGV